MTMLVCVCVCDNAVCGTELCVDKLYVTMSVLTNVACDGVVCDQVVCDIFLCVCVTEAEEKEEEADGCRTEKQEHHTMMWGKRLKETLELIFIKPCKYICAPYIVYIHFYDYTIYI